MLAGKTLFFLPNGMGKGRKKVLETQSQKHGAQLSQNIAPLPSSSAQDKNETPASFLIIVEDDLSANQLSEALHLGQGGSEEADAYKSTNDKWRALSYDKAIQAIKHFPRKITQREEVLELKGIGTRLADKVWEICESGELRKADEMSSNEKVQTMNLLTNIWGVGPTIAEQWYVQGIRTLDDVKNKAKLTHQQKIGFQYYDEFLQRMPHEEAAEIVNVVVSGCSELLPDLICEACGFLTDHLVECHVDGNQKKYMGVCLLPGPNRIHRRIDIIAVPYDEYAPSLIYFTGSAHFTRSIYAKAKSMGMRLNHHGLRGGIMRQAGEKLNDGYVIPTPTEKSVFEALGVPYRTPQERDHP